MFELSKVFLIGHPTMIILLFTLVINVIINRRM